MLLEILRLLVVLAVAIFHRPLVSILLTQDRALDSYFRSRGVWLPPPLSDAAANNLFFWIGILASVGQAAKIWLLIEP
jgi:hypothetical protein